MDVIGVALLILIMVPVSHPCGDPPSVSHATVSVTTRKMSNMDSLKIATYTCDSANGYATRGNNTIACLSLHGYTMWTSVLVSCSRVRCNSAPYMEQATHDFLQVSQRSRSASRIVYYYYYYNRYSRLRSYYTAYSREYYTYSQSREIYYTGYVTFTCNTNYYLPDGSRTIRTYCGDQGNWVAPNATCQGKDCGPVSTMIGVTCTGGSTRYPDSQSCSCDAGYERASSLQFTVTCQAFGSWSTPSDGGATSCTKVNCGDPPVIQNSDTQATVLTGTRYQDRVTYTCLPGYEVRTGSYSIVCQANRRWTTAPACIKKDCGDPPNIPSGGIPRHLYNTTFDTELRYTCDSLGYNMVGSPLVRCSESGTWSTPPICHKVNCGSPPFVQNSERHVFGHSYNDTATYECDVGYELTGDESITCQVTGYWTIPPVCQELDCGSPPDIENTENSTLITGTEVGSEARYTCLPGYKMSGEPVIECLANQQWSTAPQCQRIRCGSPPQIRNGARSVYGHYLHDRTKYECHTGYLMVGDEFIYCEANGHWTVPPECDAITCGVPPTPDNAGLVSITGTHFGQTATYQCLPGYTTDDPLYITCQLNGTWSRAPNCTFIQTTMSAPPKSGTTVPPELTMEASALSSTSTQATIAMPTTEPDTIPPLLITEQSVTQTASKPPISEVWFPLNSERSAAESLPSSSADYSGITKALSDQSSNKVQLLPTTSPSSESSPHPLSASRSSVGQTQILSQSQNPKDLQRVLTTFSGSTISPPVPDIPTDSAGSRQTLKTSPNVKTSLSPRPIDSTETKKKATTAVQSSPSQLNSTPNPHTFKILFQNNGTAPKTENYSYKKIKELNTKKGKTTSNTTAVVTSGYNTFNPNRAAALSGTNSKEPVKKDSSHSGKVLIGCSAALVVTAAIATAVAFYIVKRRRRGQHSIMPISNALYEADGQAMTIYSFKEVSHTPD